MEKVEGTFLLPLDIQLFSETPPTDTPDEPIEQPGATDPQTPTGGEPEKTPEGATFTQADLDRIVKERLEREKRKREADLEKEREEAERKRLLEEQKYKDLYEKLQQDLEAQRTVALQVKKEALLVKAGYSDEQAKTLVKLIEGESDEELNASLESVKALFPAKTEKSYGDPNPGNGGKPAPKKVNLEDKGKSAYERLKEIGKIKGRK